MDKKLLVNGNEAEFERNLDLTADIERSMNKFFLKEFQDDDDTCSRTERIVVPPLNPLIIHAISLHQYANNTVELIRQNETGKKTEKVELKMPRLKHSQAKSSLNFTPDEFKQFRENGEVAVPVLSEAIVQQILYKCVATIFSHIGYESGQQSAVDVLTDVLQEFLKKISRQLLVAMEDEQDRDMAGFPNIIERVLTEMGMGGVKGLDDFYQSRVVKYVKVLENHCKELNEEYQTSPIKNCPSPVDKFSNLVRVKVEEEEVVEVENAEVHFSTIDGDVNFSILETGYQLLNSLEAETNLQNMGGEEEIAVSESPGVISVSSEEMARYSPYNKRKRFK